MPNCVACSPFTVREHCWGLWAADVQCGRAVLCVCCVFVVRTVDTDLWSVRCRQHTCTNTVNRHTPTYDAFQLPPCPELESLASQLRHSDMTLPLASASTTWRRCRQFAYKHVSLCISVIRSVTKCILLNCLHCNFYFTVFVVIKIKKKKT
jgi:hypothetical protein